MSTEQSPFLRIPSEIRLIIYDLLFDDRGHKTIEIRNLAPDVYKRTQHVNRSKYRILSRDLVRCSAETTYVCLTDIHMHTSIMGVNRKIHEETTHVLYGGHAFSFERDIEAAMPFFQDLTIKTRPLVQEISVIKQGSVYSRENDRCEWSNLCEFLKENMQLRSLKLTVEGGRPSLGWDGLPIYSARDFGTMSKLRHEGLDWVWELLSIKGIRNLDIGSEIHHCPPSHSKAMAFFAAFSASIEKGFAEFLRAEMLALQ